MAIQCRALSKPSKSAKVKEVVKRGSRKVTNRKINGKVGGFNPVN
jgi:hypothetical protein